MRGGRAHCSARKDDEMRAKLDVQGRPHRRAHRCDRRKGGSSRRAVVATLHVQGCIGSSVRWVAPQPSLIAWLHQEAPSVQR
jgi:hypothetical protein